MGGGGFLIHLGVREPVITVQSFNKERGMIKFVLYENDDEHCV